MKPLSPHNLPEDIQTFSYDRDAVNIGIVHFGVGNFHRAHQAVYVEELLDKGEAQWGIAGVSLRSSSMKDALRPQDYIYTLSVLGEQSSYRVIGAIKDVIAAPDTPKTVIDLLAKPETQLVSSTITEKGYYLSSGTVDFEHPALKAESCSLESPTTIYGYVARGLMERFQNAPSSKLTIMCCDNISSGGELIKEGVKYLLEKHDQNAFTWTNENVSFISSMVDRVSPATDDKLRAAVLRVTGRNDAAPVSAEPFTQWIIENNFAGEQPAFDKVGAVFVKDISPFERMKLRYLNAAHSMASTLGYLNGTHYVHEALRRPNILKFIHEALYKNILPHAAVPEGYCGKTYIEDVIKRFENGNLPYANLQVGTDSSQKIQQRWFPTIDAALRQGNESKYFALCLAAWVVFIETALKNDVLNDPKKSEFAQVNQNDIGERVQSYLEISNAQNFEFFNQVDFMRSVKDYANEIKNLDMESTLKKFLNTI